MKRAIAAALFGALAVAVSAHSEKPQPSVDYSANAGVVRSIDRSAREITIDHGPLPEFDMPPMTMVFRVRSRRLLDRVKVGDKIRFRPALVGGVFTVTEIKPAR